jgi:hypothetical protein
MRLKSGACIQRVKYWNILENIKDIFPVLEGKKRAPPEVKLTLGGGNLSVYFPYFSFFSL